MTDKEWLDELEKADEIPDEDFHRLIAMARKAEEKTKISDEQFSHILRLEAKVDRYEKALREIAKDYTLPLDGGLSVGETLMKIATEALEEDKNE